jgi:hypothetical protein
MSYSRWQDERYWPKFRDALFTQHPSLSESGLLKAREFNLQRYYFQGIGRYEPDAAFARGLADLQVLANLIPAEGYMHGPKPTSIDAMVWFESWLLSQAVQSRGCIFLRTKNRRRSRWLDSRVPVSGR